MHKEFNIWQRYIHTSFSRTIGGIFRFPTFTFCLQQPYLTHSETDITTFDDLDQLINKTKESFTAVLSVQGSNTLPSWFDNIELDLTNETILATYFPNTTLDDVWSFVPRTSDVPPFPLGICAQLSVPIKRITKKMTIFLSIRIKEDNTSDDGSMYMVEMMDKLMSRYNTQFDWSHDIEIVESKSQQIGRLNMEIKRKVNSNHDPCFDSIMTSQTCVDNIIVDALKCYPKWYKSQQNFRDKMAGVSKALEPFVQQYPSWVYFSGAGTRMLKEQNWNKGIKRQIPRHYKVTEHWAVYTVFM